MLVDTTGAAGRGNPKATRCRAVLRVAELMELAERMGMHILQIADVVERFCDVGAGLEPDIVVEMLLLSELNDVVAVENMFKHVSGDNLAPPPNQSVDQESYRIAEEAARRELEARVRLEASAREQQNQVKAMEMLKRDAYSLRPGTQAIVMDLMEQNQEMARTVQEFVLQFEGKARASGNELRCEGVRRFMDELTQRIMEHYSDTLTLVIKNQTSSKPTEEDYMMLQSVVEDCLQTIVVMPVQVSLIEAYKLRHAPTDAQLYNRQTVLRRQSQEFFGIPKHCISQDKWSHAVDALSDLDDALHVTPNMRLKILTYVKVAIERCYQAELIGQGKTADENPLSADDVLPIFAFIVANASVQSIFAITEYLRDITSPTVNQFGETSYYQCVLEAAINHLLTLDLPSAQ
eukprot:TRINITY_DN59795_c0_g1_i2.p1 TRINITY_DN59795_c0_g1~~TRINITY_DN59795_c0_g1_i2.p1  ORF type:complete len:406 (+),score=86.01 TRINITY_DN59795_c0_g1_i2:159-1376(+)